MTDRRVTVSIDTLLQSSFYRFADGPSSRRKRPANACPACGKPWRGIDQAARCCDPYGCATATLLDIAENGARDGTSKVAPRLTSAEFLALRRRLDSPSPNIMVRVMDVWGQDDRDWVLLLALLGDLLADLRSGAA